MVSDVVAQRAHTGHSCDPREVSPDLNGLSHPLPRTGMVSPQVP